MSIVQEALNLEAKVQDLELRLEESLSRKILDLEDINWVRTVGRESDNGLSLNELHKLVVDLRDAAATNPLHKRGAQLRHAYVFGRGVNFENVAGTRAKAHLDNPYNQTALFSVQAYETNNLALFTDGNFFVVRDENTNILTVVPIDQITAEVTDPDDASKVRYFLRSWTSVNAEGRAVEKQRWYPVARFKKTQVGRGRRNGKINKTISILGKSIPVAQDAVIYHHTSNRQAGWTYGIPDSLAALVWAVAYSEYLRDNAALVKALQQIAWSISTATKTGTKNAAAQVVHPGVGGTAAMTAGTSLSSVGVPSAQVDFNKGQPLAALVASSFGVPVIALLSSPGATGGSYGAAQTLDFPTIKTMQAIQDSWTVLYVEILRDMGAPDARVSFPSIENDPAYREIQSLAQAYALGALHRAEFRNGVLDILDVQKTSDELPEPDGFNNYNDPNDSTDADGGSDPIARQGNTGAVPGGVNQDVTDHSGDED